MALTQGKRGGFASEVFLNLPTIGTSSDAKPTTAEHGERYFEKDTGDEYIYNLDSVTEVGAWVLYREHFASAGQTGSDSPLASSDDQLQFQMFLELKAIRLGLSHVLHTDLMALATGESLEV